MVLLPAPFGPTMPMSPVPKSMLVSACCRKFRRLRRMSRTSRLPRHHVVHQRHAFVRLDRRTEVPLGEPDKPLDIDAGGAPPDTAEEDLDLLRQRAPPVAAGIAHDALHLGAAGVQVEVQR